MVVVTGTRSLYTSTPPAGFGVASVNITPVPLLENVNGAAIGLFHGVVVEERSTCAIESPFSNNHPTGFVESVVVGQTAG